MISHIRKLTRSLLIIALIMVYFCSSALAASYACKINTSTKVYKRASTSSASMKVSKNTKCTMTAVNGSWARIKKGSTTAYIPVKYLTLTDRITAYTDSRVSMYKRASSSSSKVCTLAEGTTVYINGREGSYFRCQNKNGSVTGYVKMSGITYTKPKNPASSDDNSDKDDNKNTSSDSIPEFTPDMSKSETISFIIDVAESLKGKPYATDANPPSSFDCSRFVRYCFGLADISLPSTAKSQGYSTSYDRINSTGDLKRGDVVVFNTNSSDSDLADHTGIYTGNGYFIHASSSAGKVIVSTLSSGYYKRTFSWGLRIIE